MCPLDGLNTHCFNSANGLNTFTQHFMLRAEAESDFSIKHIIPYVIVSECDGKILTYRRCGSEQRLKGKLSAGIGGHVNEHDRQLTIYQTLLAGLQRETKEEIGITTSASDFKLIGMINEEKSDVGHCHIGIVFRLFLSFETPAFDKEISCPQWVSPESLRLDEFELWSQLALRLINN